MAEPARMRGGMGSGRGFAAGMAKGKPDKTTIKRLLGYIVKDNGLRLAGVFICILIGAAATVASSLFLETLIDDYIAPLLLRGSTDISGIVPLMIKMICLFALSIFSTFLYNRIMVYISQGVQKKIRDEMFSHMQTLPVKYFDTHTFGDVMSRYTNDIDTLRQMVSQSVPQLFSSSVTIISVFAAMIFKSPLLTLFVIFTVAIMFMFTGKIAGKSGRFFIRQQESLGDVNGYIEEMINGQKVVKVFCHEEKSKLQFDGKNENLCENAYKANMFANILGPVMNNLGHLQYVLIAIVGGVFAIYGVGAFSLGKIRIGALTLGGVVAYLQLSKSFTNPINQVSQQLNSVIMALAGAKRIFALMDEESETDDGYVTLVNAKTVDGEITETPQRTGMWAWKHPHSDGSVTYTRVCGEVTLNGVDFGYEENKPVLRDITLYAKPGQKVAFVGATGAGKTTVTNLINRFYDIADGKIRYDGININKIKKDDLRRSLGMVLQDTNLFTGTVMENIRYGKLDAADEEVYAAARLANADDFIRRLPEGYNTMLRGNASRLSQGQRQLIAIARAAVADPPVMILDEATSSIDTRTEALVQRGMDKLMDGRTVFVIAHRLSTVRNSDVIMVLEHGEIIERGTHEKLIEEKGRYYQLYTGAFELD